MTAQHPWKENVTVDFRNTIEILTQIQLIELSDTQWNTHIMAYLLAPSGALREPVKNVLADFVR